MQSRKRGNYHKSIFRRDFSNFCLQIFSESKVLILKVSENVKQLLYRVFRDLVEH